MMEFSPNGWIVLDKPLKMGSTEAVGKVKWLLKKAFGSKVKVGHAGTLDPLATGILPIAVGEATKAIRLAQDADKEYTFTARFGSETDSCDLEGVIIHTSQLPNPTQSQVESILEGFRGEIDQVPPAFSAIKVQGERAYDLARKGEVVEIPSRKVMVYELEMLDFRECEADFKVVCGKGTYVRSLARDMGRKLGCFATVTALRRTRVGKFSQEIAISLENLENLLYSRAFDRCILPLEIVLDDILAIDFEQVEVKKLQQGQLVSVLPERFAGQEVSELCAVHNGKLIAIGSVSGGQFKPERVFNH